MKKLKNIEADDIKLFFYCLGTILATIGIALLPSYPVISVWLISVALTDFTFIGWRNVLYAILTGIFTQPSHNPTADLPEGDR
jgi:hypothetical protein